MTIFKLMKKINVLSLLFFFALLAVSRVASLDASAQNATTHESQVVVPFQKKGVTFLIPKRYLGSPIEADSGSGASAALIIGEEKSIVGSLPTGAKVCFNGKGECFVSLLIWDNGSEWNLSDLMGHLKKSGGLPSESLGEKFGLAMERQVPPKDWKAGGWFWKEFYHKGSAGSPSVVIACDGDDTVQFPRCEQYFLFDGLLVKVGHDARILPDWGVVQDRINARLREWRR